MTRGVCTMVPGDPLNAAALAMQELNMDSLPICENDGLVGMVTDRGMAVRSLTAERPAALLKDVMRSEPLYCFADESVDQNKHLVGILARGRTSQRSEAGRGDAD